jgi:WD40 repeat protein
MINWLEFVQVRGLEFNVITPNLLASGGDDGDIFIWDLVEPTSPSHFPALRVGHSVIFSWPFAFKLDMYLV